MEKAFQIFTGFFLFLSPVYLNLRVVLLLVVNHNHNRYFFRFKSSTVVSLFLCLCWPVAASFVLLPPPYFSNEFNFFFFLVQLSFIILVTTQSLFMIHSCVRAAPVKWLRLCVCVLNDWNYPFKVCPSPHPPTYVCICLRVCVCIYGPCRVAPSEKWKILCARLSLARNLLLYFIFALPSPQSAFLNLFIGIIKKQISIAYQKK